MEPPMVSATIHDDQLLAAELRETSQKNLSKRAAKEGVKLYLSSILHERKRFDEKLYFNTKCFMTS
jgi:hypothetical protein